jgi:hypothetical protein
VLRDRLREYTAQINQLRESRARLIPRPILHERAPLLELLSALVGWHALLFVLVRERCLADAIGIECANLNSSP